MIVAGIDPGVSGALAVVNGFGDFCETTDMPLTKSRHVDGAAVHRWLIERDVEFAVIEHAQAMPKQGVVSMFNYGQAFGQALGIVQTMMPWTLVRPQMWKKQVGLIKADKSMSRALATKKFPKSAGQFKLAKDHGRAEAALIAWWWLHHPLRQEQNLEAAA